MTREEFRDRLARIGLSCDEFAALTNTSLRTVYEWGGRSPVPYLARCVLRLLEERGGAHGLLGRQHRGGISGRCRA